MKLYTLKNEFIAETRHLPKKFTGFALFSNRTKIYFKDGKPHYENGAAYTWADGSQEYYINGNLHRIGGYARIRIATEIKEYWVNDKKITDLEHNLLCDIMKLKGLLK
jgi:hypothetical protein